MKIGMKMGSNKTVKWKKVVEIYFDAASIIDINNHMHQGGLALETAWRTHSDFTEAVAKGLLLQNSVGIQVTHTRVETENAALPYNILPLSSLPMYNKNSEQCTGTYASRLCSICRNPCKNYCKDCSDTAKNQIVSLCGLKSKQGSTCLVKHIVQCNCIHVIPQLVFCILLVYASL